MSARRASKEKDVICEILDIFWERVFLHFIVRNTTGRDIYLRSDGKPLVRLESKPINEEDKERLKLRFIDNKELSSSKDSLFSIELNMTAACGRSFLENAKWEVGYYDSDTPPIGGRAYKHYVERGSDSILRGKEVQSRKEHLKKFGIKDEVIEETVKKVDLFTFCTIESKLVSKLEELDKLFRYDNTKYAYTVDFTVFEKNGAGSSLNINSFFMVKNNNWKADL